MFLSLIRDGVINTLASIFERRPELGYPIGAGGVLFGALAKWWPVVNEWVNVYMVIGGAVLLTLTIIAQARNAFRSGKKKRDG